MVSSDKTGLSNNNSFVGSKVVHEIIKDDQRERELLPDPFTNDIILGPLDWVRLAIGTVVLLPIRALAVILTLCLVSQKNER